MVSDRVEVDRVAQHVWVVVLRGEHDLATAAAVRGAIDEVFAEGSRVVLDLSDATFIDSTMVATVIVEHSHARHEANDEFVVVAPPDSPARHLFDLTGVDQVVNVYENRQTALAAVSR